MTKASSHGGARRDLLLGLGAFLLFALGSLALLIALNPASKAWFSWARAPTGEGSIAITLVHTNDTWGYLRALG